MEMVSVCVIGAVTTVTGLGLLDKSKINKFAYEVEVNIKNGVIRAINEMKKAKGLNKNDLMLVGPEDVNMLIEFGVGYARMFSSDEAVAIIDNSPYQILQIVRELITYDRFCQGVVSPKKYLSKYDIEKCLLAFYDTKLKAYRKMKSIENEFKLSDMKVLYDYETKKYGVYANENSEMYLLKQRLPFKREIKFAYMLEK